MSNKFEYRFGNTASDDLELAVGDFCIDNKLLKDGEHSFSTIDGEVLWMRFNEDGLRDLITSIQEEQSGAKTIINITAGEGGFRVVEAVIGSSFTHLIPGNLHVLQTENLTHGQLDTIRQVIEAVDEVNFPETLPITETEKLDLPIKRRTKLDVFKRAGAIALNTLTQYDSHYTHLPFLLFYRPQ